LDRCSKDVAGTRRVAQHRGSRALRHSVRDLAFSAENSKIGAKSVAVTFNYDCPTDVEGAIFSSVPGGFLSIGPNAALDRDSDQQTAADLMQLVREIEVGMDADGDGIADLDPSRIYYFGSSQGGIYGTVIMFPDVLALCVKRSILSVENLAGALS